LADATRRTEIRDGDRVVEYSVREYRRMRSSALVGDSALIRHHLDEAAFGRARTDATIRAPDEQLASEVARAFELLDRIDPRWTPPFEFLAKWIVGIDSPILYSTSFYSLPGVVVFRVAPDDPLWNAELILHEAAHNWLHELMRISPLMTLESSSRPVRSPWRADMRPLRGVLVGAHAFLIVASLMTRLWARHEEPQAAVAQRAVIELGRASTGMTMLARRAEWTTDGARFFSTLRRVESDVRDEQENLRRQSVELLAQPARHAWPTHGV
jgi:HEXXH motif-containing protein